MAAVIYKYPLALREKQTLLLPECATILKVAMQHGRITLWALHELGETTPAEYEILIFGTGHPTHGAKPENYLDTVMDSGGYVWHVFACASKNGNSDKQEDLFAEIEKQSLEADMADVNYRIAKAGNFTIDEVERAFAAIRQAGLRIII